MSGARGTTTRQDEVARGYNQFQRIVNYTGFAGWLVCAGLTIKVLIDFDPSQTISGYGWIAAAAVLAALPVADFISGFVHWAADNYGHEDWPGIGGFVKPFRNHHVDPEDMAHHGFWEMHGDHFCATIPCFGFGMLVDGTGASAFFFKVMWFWVAVFIIATAKFHAWAHTKEPARVIRWLQRVRLILSPEHHGGHHTPPYSKNYCITNGWMNGPLRAIRFFETCEWLIRLTTGAVALTKQDHAPVDPTDVQKAKSTARSI